MGEIDFRIRDEHVKRYGCTEDVESYLRTLEGLRPLRDDEAGDNHHMLAQSVWPEYSILKTNPWNRLRVSWAIHNALTEIQSWFEERLRSAALLRKGQTAEAFLAACSSGGKVVHAVKGEDGKSAHAVKAGKRCHELHPNRQSEISKRTHQLHPNLASQMGKVAKRRWDALTPEQRREANRGNIEAANQWRLANPEQAAEIARKGSASRSPETLKICAQKMNAANAAKSLEEVAKINRRAQRTREERFTKEQRFEWSRKGQFIHSLKGLVRRVVTEELLAQTV